MRHGQTNLLDLMLLMIYIMFLRNARSEVRGGYVVLAVKSPLQCKLVDSFCVNTCEFILVDVLVIRSIYMSCYIWYSVQAAKYLI